MITIIEIYQNKGMVTCTYVLTSFINDVLRIVFESVLTYVGKREVLFSREAGTCGVVEGVNVNG